MLPVFEAICSIPAAYRFCLLKGIRTSAVSDLEAHCHIPHLLLKPTVENKDSSQATDVQSAVEHFC